MPLARSLFRKGADFTAAMAFEIASTNIGITWNYTTWLTIAFPLLAAGLLVRFWRTGGPAMVQMMDGSPDHAEHEHGGDRMYNGHHH